ncbi:MAG TPA: methyl-accepting chemotaxis protein [Nannocystaceae bacterium]|nr:methyl-accepting chemotaxis protein [Nannocystaceae bacterium]
MSEVTSHSEVLDAVWAVLRRRILERGVAATELLGRHLHSLGPLRRAGGELFAGDVLINHNDALLAPLVRATSLGLAVYLGNRRVAATSLLDAGRTPPVDEYADAELVDAVVRRREVFRGYLLRGDARHLVVARPLYVGGAADERGPLGFVEAFQDEGTFFELLTKSASETSAGRRQAVWADGIEAIAHFLDDVARRLQLLALNGNIIAAQAGEHGRAFRVVCRELGTLAERARHTLTDVEKLTQALAQESLAEPLEFGAAEAGSDEPRR